MLSVRKGGGDETEHQQSNSFAYIKSLTRLCFFHTLKKHNNKHKMLGKEKSGQGQGQGGKPGGTPMTSSAASRIQSAEARSGSGGVESGGFASRAQSAAARHAQGGGGGKGAGGQGEGHGGGHGGGSKK